MWVLLLAIRFADFAVELRGYFFHITAQVVAVFCETVGYVGVSGWVCRCGKRGKAQKYIEKMFHIESP